MTEDEFDVYYQTKSEEAYQKDLVQIWLNMISSCTTLQELEDLHHDETFLETYQTQQFKEAFEKRFNELKEEQEKKKELFKLQIINKINSHNKIEWLNDLFAVHNEFILNNEDVKSLYESKKESLIKQEEQQRITNSINKINQCKTLEELKSLKDIEDVVDVAYFWTLIEILRWLPNDKITSSYLDTIIDRVFNNNDQETDDVI